MKATIERTALLEGLEKIVGVAAGSKNLPVLANVLIGINSGASLAEFRGTDIETYVKNVVSGVSADMDGQLMVPAKSLFDIAKSLAPGSIEITTNDTAAKITQGKTKFKLALGNPDEFPQPPEIQPEAIVVVTGKDFQKLIGKVIYAKGINDGEYVLMSILLKIEGEDLAAVTTDGKRLALYAIPMKEPVTYSKDVLIPGRVMERLLTLIGEPEEIKIVVDASRVVFEAGGLTITLRLMNAVFPSYKEALPALTEEQYVVNREEMLSVIKKAFIIVGRDGIIDLVFDGTQFTVSVDSGTGTYDDTVDVQTDRTTPWTLRFYVKKLSEMLGVLEGKEVTIQFPEAGVIGPAFITEGVHVNILMPNRTT